MRFFVDTNIVISALLFPNGKVAKVFSHLLEKHNVIISSYTREECVEVFEKKFPVKMKQLEIFFDGINFEEFKSPEKIDEKKYPKIRDKKIYLFLFLQFYLMQIFYLLGIKILKI